VKILHCIVLYCINRISSVENLQVFVRKLQLLSNPRRFYDDPPMDRAQSGRSTPGRWRLIPRLHEEAYMKHTYSIMHRYQASYSVRRVL